MKIKITVTKGKEVCFNQKKEITTDLIIGGGRTGMGYFNVLPKEELKQLNIPISDPKLELMKEVKTNVKRN